MFVIVPLEIAAEMWWQILIASGMVGLAVVEITFALAIIGP